MLLQRLVADKNIGFNYDLMGAAEYEFGATRNGRAAIAQAYLKGDISAKRTLFIEAHGSRRSPGVKVAVLARPETLAKIGDEMIVQVVKECFYTDDERIIGWMNVGQDYVEPMMIIRENVEDMRDRVNDFFRPFIKEMVKG